MRLIALSATVQRRPTDSGLECMMPRSFAVFAIVLVTVILSYSCAKKTSEEKYQDAVESFRRRDSLGAIILAHEILREETSGTLALRARWLLVRCHINDYNFRECHRVLKEIIDQTGLDQAEGQEAARWKIRTYEVTRETTAALEQSEAFLEAATTGTAFWAELMLGVGSHLRAADQLTTAQDVFAQVLNNSEVPKGHRFEALSRLAACYATTASAAAGIEFFEHHLADEPSTNIVPNVYLVMAHLATVLDDEDRAEGFYVQGFEAFEQMYKDATGADKKIEVLIRYARAYNFKDELEAAVALLQEGLKKFPTSPKRLQLYYELARAYASNEKYDKAIEVYREIPTLFPNHPGRLEAYFLVAECHRLQKDFDAAMTDYQEITTLFPQTPVARRAYQEIRHTEFLRRKEAETSTTLALAAAQATSPTATLTTGSALSTAPIPPALSLPPEGAAAQTPVPAGERAKPDKEGWIALFNGKDLSGWHVHSKSSPNFWVAENGELVNKQTGTNLISDAPLMDHELHIEFNCPARGNSGVYLQGRYEVQVSDSFGQEELRSGMCGGIYGKIAPKVNAAKAAGEWQSFDIKFYSARLGPDGKVTKNVRITVVHNGMLIINYGEIHGLTGGSVDRREGTPAGLMLQGDHTAVRYRNIKYRPIKAQTKWRTKWRVEK